MRKFVVHAKGKTLDIFKYLQDVLKGRPSFQFNSDIEWLVYNEGEIGFIRTDHKKAVDNIVKAGFQYFKNLDQLKNALYPPVIEKRYIFKIAAKQDSTKVKEKVKETIQLLSYLDNTDLCSFNSVGWCYELTSTGLHILFHENHEQYNIMKKQQTIHNDIYDLYHSLPKTDFFFFI
jgi:hypothetical protein